MRYLPIRFIDDVFKIVDNYMKDERVAPGIVGKRAFLKEFIKREENFPKELLKEINDRRGNMPFSDYLTQQSLFGTYYGQYLS
jgi:hypothetical protein